MEFTFRPGVPGDIDAVTALYEAAIDRLDATTNYPGWQQGLYPTQRTAEDALSEGCLYVAEQEGTLLGSMVLRHEPLEPYAEGRWLSALDYQDILVIYTFAVHPAAQGLGVGHAMLQSAADFGVRSGIRSLRLDVYEQNLPAIHLYESCGFQCTGRVDLGLGDCGLPWFLLYEKLL